MPQTVFERNGGFARIRHVVSDFYDTVLDSALAHHFQHTDMRRLIQHQTAFIASLTGGPGAHYTDEVLFRVHAPLGITDDEFELMLRLLAEALEDHDWSVEDVALVSARFRDHRPVVVAAAAAPPPRARPRAERPAPTEPAP
ncbi:group 1 truncated hemoglobin [Geodermatophilus sp. SYSU D00758]